MQFVLDEMGHAFAVCAVKAPIVMQAGNGLAVECRLVERHVGMGAAAAKRLERAGCRPCDKNTLLADLEQAHAALGDGVCLTNKSESHEIVSRPD